MKTLLVLSALASLAIAAPTNQYYHFIAGEDTGYWPEYGYREKKSPQDLVSSPLLSDFQLDEFNQESEGPEARTKLKKFKHKGPIVVKKKSGYHVFRDSDEERDAADPREKCDKELRVKLCNEDITGKSTNKRNTGIHNDDVESTIKIAREAIESLRRDIQKLEKGANEKKEQSENAVDKVNMNIHDNIESVRDALLRVENLKALNIQPKNTATEGTHDQNNHISADARTIQWKEASQNNIHDDMSSNVANNKATTLNIENARNTQWKEAMHNKDITLNIPNNEAKLNAENARLSQWKEATTNMDIGSRVSQSSLNLDIDSKTANNKPAEQRLAQWKETAIDKEKTAETHKLETVQTEQARLSQWKNAMDNIHGHEEVPRNMENSFQSEHQGMMKSANSIAEQDMSPAASTQTSTKIEIHNQALLNKMEKSAELPKSSDELAVNNQPTDKKLNLIHDPHTKSADMMKWDHHRDDKHDEEHHHKNVYVFMKNADQLADNHESASHILNSLDKTVHNKVTGKHAEEKVEPVGHKDQHYKDVFVFMKNAEQSNADDMDKQKKHDSINGENKVSGADTTTQAKYAGSAYNKHIEHKHTGHSPVKSPHYETNIKHLPKPTTHHGYHSSHGKSDERDGSWARYGASPKPQPHTHDMHMKKPHMDEMHSGYGHTSKDKPHVEETHSGYGHMSKKPHVEESHSGYGHRSMNKPHVDESHSGYGHKSMNKPDMHSGHSYGHDDMHMGYGHSKHDSHYNHHDHHYMHGKASEFDSTMQPTDFMLMPDFLGKSALENIQWKDHLNAARATYGAPSYPSYSNYNSQSYGGSDTVGVFPYANSGCAVPLLLNCSPNVVHGKLVKSYSNYGAPAYKNEEIYKQKRDILTSNEDTQNSDNYYEKIYL